MRRGFRWIRMLATLAVVLIGVVVVTGFAFTQYATPVKRQEIERPIYTVGDPNYAAALKEGKNIVKFGRLPAGLYPGGVAFENPVEAARYLADLDHPTEGWGVYQLSGDFSLDTYERDGQTYLSRSLLVTGAASSETASVAQPPLVR